MARKIDLDRLIDLVHARHEEFDRSHPVAKWGGTPLAYRENSEYRRIAQMHHDAVEGKVSFNPLTLYRVRRLATRYLKRYSGSRLHPSGKPAEEPAVET